MFGNEISTSMPDFDILCRYFSYTLRIRTGESATLAVESVVPLVLHASGLDVPADLSGTRLMSAEFGKLV